MTATAPATMAEVDLTDLDHFAAGFPHHLFALHRREAPVWGHAPTEHTPDGEGFWSVATHAEVQQVQLDPMTYSSERGGDRTGGGTLLEDLDVAGLVLNMMDEPRHGRIRRLVTAGLTPRTVRRLEDELRRRAGALLDAGFDVREGDAGNLALSGLFEYAVGLVAEKRANPTDDMLSIAVHATLPDVEPPQLTDLELCSFFSLLFAAGAETTRNAIAGGLLALVEQPDDLAALRGDDALLGTAIEEVLRWTTPSPAKRRSATRSHTVQLAGPPEWTRGNRHTGLRHLPLVLHR